MSPSLAGVVLCLLSIATLINATVYGWGKNDQAQLGLGHQNVVYTPTSIPFYSSIPLLDLLTATNYHIALAANGTAYGSGLQFYGQFAVGYSSSTAIKTPMRCPSLNTSLDITLPGTSCNANMNTNLLGWGNVAGYVSGKSSGAFPSILSSTPSYKFDGKVLSVDSVQEGVVVRLANNTVWVAGNNGNGRLGIGTTTTTYSFVEATFWRTVSLSQIFSGQSQHSCGLSVNGSLYCWGQNSFGQLGVGDVGTHYSPTRVSFFDDNGFIIYKVSFGDSFTAVLTCGGRLFAFGANSFGQLGQGIPDSSTHPNPVEVLINNGNGDGMIVDLVTGFSQIMIRTDKNHWYTWGGGSSGSLGQGVGKDQYQPTYNPAFSTFKINRIKSSSQSLNFFGWNDPSVSNDLNGCPALVNECVTGTNDCDPNAYCSDLERGYTCACILGWQGDGYTTGSGCINMDSCAAVGNECLNYTTCDDSSGVAVCICPLGSQGDGRKDGSGCQDVNECAQGNPCAPNAYCTNLSPSYNCTCNPGFIGDPIVAGCTIQCEPGQFATNLTACSTCPPGTYTDVTGAQNCFPCPGGTYNNQYGANSLSDCQQCPVGGYSDPKATFCSLCVHGYTNDPSVLHTDNTTCTACPLGAFGYYGQCYQCDAGKFSTDATAKSCHNCPPGFESTAKGSQACTACPAGTSSRGGTTSCANCPAGYFSGPGSKDCIKCPLGTSTNGLTGQSSCSNCTAGYYSSKTAATTCSPCAAGTYSTGPGTVNCQRCAPGTFAGSSAATGCTACSNSTYASGYGSTQCTNCDFGTFTVNGVSCAPCTAGSYFDAASRTCKPCAPGTFVAVAGVNACYACSPGTFASGSGSTYCKRCDVNTYSDAKTGFANCTACPAGTKSPGGAYVCS